MKHFKTILTMTVTMLAMLFTLTCYAELADKEFSADGLYIDDPFENAIRLYGNPIKAETNNTNKDINYIFETSKGNIEIEKDEKNNTINKITLNNECSLKTYSGIQINSTIEDIYKAYGKPTYETEYSKINNEIIKSIRYTNYLPKNINKEINIIIKDNKVKTIVIYKYRDY